jgi:hypothetical protein
VADVVPAAEDRVAFGVVYELQAQDRAALDKQKGAGRPDAMYRSEQVVATCVKDGAQVRALTYSIADSRRASQNLAPSAQYKQCIVKGARSSGLPPAYVKQLVRGQGTVWAGFGALRWRHSPVNAVRARRTFPTTDRPIEGKECRLADWLCAAARRLLAACVYICVHM